MIVSQVESWKPRTGALKVMTWEKPSGKKAGVEKVALGRAGRGMPR